MAYSPTLWKRGDIITAEKLNKVETGLQAAASVDIQSAQATTLAAGAPATAVIEGGVLKLGIPRGQTGAQGAAGAQGAKGDTGAQGAKGETGATPTITATATVDATVGTPKVTVSKGGTTTAPTFTFAFTGLKGATGAQGAAGAQGAKGDTGAQGAKGETGATPTITATATVDATVGTPKVTVSKGGTTTAPTFTFAFTGLKGATGAQGVAGATGAKGETGAAGAKGDQGERGAAGAAGKNGSCFRVSATALADSQTGIAATALTPTNAQLPYAVGDIVLDATTKKLYAVTAASGGTCSIGTALATLP